MLRHIPLGVEALEDRIALSWAKIPPALITPPTVPTAVRLSTTGPTTGTASINTDEVDYYAFTAPTAGSYRLKVTTPNSNLDTVLGAFRSTGSRLAFNDNLSSTDTDSAVSVSLTTGQRLLFGVTNVTGKPGGSYTWEVLAPNRDDRYRGNDTPQRATNLGLLTTVKSVTGLMLTTPADWFRFQTNGTGAATANVTTRFTHSLGNINLALFDATGQLLRKSEGTTNQEQVALQGLPAGTYFVAVYGAKGATNPSYTMTINPAIQRAPVDDPFRGNDTRERATDLGMMVSPLRLANLALTTPSDWFRFQTSGTGTANAYLALEFTHAQGNLDLRLYNAAGSLLRSSAGTTGQERISLDGLAADDYYVEISGAINPSYTLEINAEVRPTPADDRYQGNDSAEHAANLGTLSALQNITDLVLTTAADWFRFRTTGVGSATSGVGIAFDHAAGNLDLAVFDATGKLVSRSEGMSNAERIALDGQPAGEYFVQVYGVSGATHSRYFLEINPDVRPALPPDDAYRGNDSRERAADLGKLTALHFVSDLQMSTASDWFRFRTAEAGIGSAFSYVSTRFFQSSGNLDLAVYDSTGKLVGKSAGTSSAERVSLKGLPAGEYYVQVFGAAGATNSQYTLEINPELRIPPTDDIYRGNDTPGRAANLGVLSAYWTIDNLALTTQSDWFRFRIDKQLPVATNITVRFLHDEGNIDVGLYTVSGQFLGASAGQRNVEMIPLENLPPGEYLLRVTSPTGATHTSYSMSFSRDFIKA